MGVVHKLKDEIISFIVQKKSDEPSISCRSLAEVVSEYFGQKISKSSISNVLKELNLSSPIGRPAVAYKKTRKTAIKYTLPSKKKKDLFIDPSNHAILSDLKKDPGDENFIDGAGVIFLKAAGWETFSQSFFFELLKEFSSLNDDEKVRKAAEVLCSFKAFHIESLEEMDLYDGTGLLKLNGVDKNLRKVDILQVIDSIANPEDLFLKFSLKAPQVFSEVSGFNFRLNDGASFFVDGQRTSVWKSPQQCFPVSLIKATDSLAEMLNNVQSTVFCSNVSKSNVRNEKKDFFYDFVGAFENVQSKKIIKVELIDENGAILSEFNEVPHVKRKFIAGVWEWDSLFQKFLDIKKVSMEGKVDRDVAGRDLSFKEVYLKETIGGKLVRLRGVLLYDLFAHLPWIILVSNIPAEEMDIYEMVNRYCGFWPYMEKGASLFVLSNPSMRSKDLSTVDKNPVNFFTEKVCFGKKVLWTVAEQVLLALDRFARRQFFPQEYAQKDFYTMRHRFYSLPGRVVLKEKETIIEINLPKNYPYREDVLFAVIRFNERRIKDFTQKRVSVNIYN